MIEDVTLKQPCLGYDLTVRALAMGADYALTLSGGCRPHVGSVSAAYWEDGAVRCETSVGRGHRDDVLSRRFAEEIAQACRCNVSVSCGIHYDDLTKADLSAVLAAAEQLLQRLTETLASA